MSRRSADRGTLGSARATAIAAASVAIVAVLAHLREHGEHVSRPHVSGLAFRR